MIAYIKTFLKYQCLLKELVIKDIKIKYRRSALGYVWSILNPLLMMIVISTVFSYMFRHSIENYPIYLLTGQLIYNFYSESTNQAMRSIIGGGGLIKKVYVPKYIFPLAKIFSSFVNMLFSLVAIVIMLFITRAKITPIIFLFPLPLLYTLLFTIGVGLIISVITVYFRDMLHLYGVFLTALMYFTPLFYPVDSLPEYARIAIQFNPLYHFVFMFRQIVLYGEIPSLRSNIICLGMGIFVTSIGLLIFKKKQDDFVLYL